MKSIQFGIVLAVAGIGIAAAGGCASSRKSEASAALVDVRSALVFRGDGAAASWPELSAAAGAADAVLLGENHGHPLGLASAASLWGEVLASATQSALCMEFFERDQQVGLDDYLAGLTDEAAFRKATGRTDSGYPAGHREMVESAKAHRRPVIAGNAPRRYVRLARTEGYDRLAALLPEQRRLFRIPDALPGPESQYRVNFDRVMSGEGEHGSGASPARSHESQARLDATFRSQSLWDWTMAESVAGALAAGQRPVVLVVGRFHIDNQGGTLLALRGMRPGAKIVTVSFVDEWSSSLREQDRGRADFVVYVGPSAVEEGG